MGHTWSLFFCQKAIEEAMSATPSLDKAEVLQDTRSCVVPRSSDDGNDAESSPRATKKFFYVYVDNLSILGTSRVNVDEDLRMALQTLKSRGMDTHLEIVHSDTAIALGIHMDLRNMLVSVAPMCLWRLKQSSLGAALSGSTWKTWEVLLGHMTFVVILRRSVCLFMRANQNDSARLWPSARAEVQALCRSSAGNR